MRNVVKIDVATYPRTITTLSMIHNTDRIVESLLLKISINNIDEEERN